LVPAGRYPPVVDSVAISKRRANNAFRWTGDLMSAIVYKGFRDDEMESQFNPRAAVPEFPRLAEQRSKASLRVRQTLKSFLDVPYGDSPRQTLDIFPADRRDARVLMYFHGGYWRGGSKEDNCHFAPAFVNAGATVVLVEYDLCPNVTVGEIVRQSRSAIAWVYRHVREYGGDPSMLYVAGSSAGGHLVAMALAHDWERERLPRDLIKGAVAISGVYDPDAVLHIDVNEDIRLTPETARENSPLHHPPLSRAPLVIAVGGGETTGWKQMSEDFFKLCRDRGVACEYLEVPDENHFSLSAVLADPESLLTRAILGQMGLPTRDTA
jgi:arylformamidase